MEKFLLCYFPQVCPHAEFQENSVSIFLFLLSNKFMVQGLSKRQSETWTKKHFDNMTPFFWRKMDKYLTLYDVFYLHWYLLFLVKIFIGSLEKIYVNIETLHTKHMVYFLVNWGAIWTWKLWVVKKFLKRFLYTR